MNNFGALLVLMVGRSCIGRSTSTIIHNNTTVKEARSTKSAAVKDSTSNITTTTISTRGYVKDESVPWYLIFSRASNHTHRGHHLSVGFTYIVSSAFSLIIVIGVSCNILLIYTIASVSRLHSHMHCFIVNMAIGDVITALGAIPFDIEYMLTPSFTGDVVACGFMHTVFLAFLPSQVLALILVTAERYISIVFTMKRKRILTKRTVIGAIIVSRLYTLMVGLIPVVSRKGSVQIIHGVCLLMFPICYQTFQVVCNFIIPIGFFLYVYAQIYKISYEQANKTAKTIQSLGVLHESERLSTTENAEHDLGEEIQDISKYSQSRNKLEVQKQKHRPTDAASMSHNTRASRHIAMLVSVCVLCWLFFILTVFINYNCQCLSREFTWIVNVINYSSTAINPVLYGFLNSTIRKEARKKLQKLWTHFGNQISQALESLN